MKVLFQVSSLWNIDCHSVFIHQECRRLWQVMLYLTSDQEALEKKESTFKSHACHHNTILIICHWSLLCATKSGNKHLLMLMDCTTRYPSVAAACYPEHVYLALLTTCSHTITKAVLVTATRVCDRWGNNLWSHQPSTVSCLCLWSVCSSLGNNVASG